MKYLSVCSGIEAASAAWMPLGWKPVAFSEIEPFPSSVLAHHHPDAPNWGDMTKFEEWPDESIDLLCGGTPCQSFSVAGLRKGLADPRGNLMLTFGAIAAKYRPRWLVWENVPGVLSSNGGRDFGSFLGLLGELGYGFAYRVLDAQYVRVQSHPRAVPQRRRRVFVVGHSGGLWQRAAAVLFERASLCGHPAPSRKAGEGFAGTTARSLAIRGRDGTPQAELGEDVANAVLTPCGGRGGIGVGSILQSTAWPAEVASTLNAHYGDKQGLEDQHALSGGQLFVPAERVALPECGSDRQAVAVSLRGREGGATAELGDDIPNCLRAELTLNDTWGAIKCAGGKPGQGYPAAIVNMAVRRLTPLECERLQGFPTVSEKVIIEACLDQQNQGVRAALKCLRWQNSAWPADAGVSMPNARTAAQPSSTRQAAPEPLAALHVQLLYGHAVQAIRSRGRLIWSANGAAASEKSPQPTPDGNTAAELAWLLHVVAKETTVGKVGSPDSIRLSFPALSGATSAEKSGHATVASASGAESAQSLDTFTTSDLGQITTCSDSTAATLCCSVLRAIAGCIPSETLPATFSIELTVESPYTNVPRRGKPAADGPRYKALGNSWAVNCARWIGERIEQVESIKVTQARNAGFLIPEAT